MSPSVYHISIPNLLIIFIPLIIVVFIYLRWTKNEMTLPYAAVRMVVQLILIGFVLTYIFYQNSLPITLMILTVMLAISAWIALRPVKDLRKVYYGRTLFALCVGSVPVLFLVVVGVVQLEPWFSPRYTIPLAGMIFANSMNSVSLCAERFHAEIHAGGSYEHSRRTAYRTALLPLINSFFAVGLVSFPGMMTGQILAGVSPLLAVRYQIMVMCMVLGGAGISSAVYLRMMRKTCPSRAFEN